MLWIFLCSLTFLPLALKERCTQRHPKAGVPKNKKKTFPTIPLAHALLKQHLTAFDGEGQRPGKMRVCLSDANGKCLLEQTQILQSRQNLPKNENETRRNRMLASGAFQNNQKSTKTSKKTKRFDAKSKTAPPKPTTENAKKARNIKEKRTIEMFNTA